MSQDAADVRSTTDAGRYLAILNPTGAVGKAHQGCCVLFGARLNGTVGNQVLDGCIIDIAEGSGALVLGVANRGGDGVVVAVERTLESVALRRLSRHGTHNLRYVDVGIEAYEFALIAIERRVEVGDVRGNFIPVFGAGDDVGTLLRTLSSDDLRHDIPLRIEDDDIRVEQQVGVGRIACSGEVGLGVPFSQCEIGAFRRIVVQANQTAPDGLMVY